MNKTLRSLICAALAIMMMLGLVACPAPDPNGGTSSTTTPPNGENPGNNPGGEQPGEGTDTGKPLDTAYGDGAAIPGTGDRLSGSAVLTEKVFDDAAAVEKTPAAIRNMFREDKVPAGVYKVSGADPVKFSASTAKEYTCNGAVIISESGFLFENCKDVLLSDITLVGAVSFVGCENVTLRNVQILAEGKTAVTADSASSKIYLREARITGKTAVDNGADDLYVLDSYVGYAEKGIVDTSKKNLYVSNVRFVGTAGAAILTASHEAELRRITVDTGADTVAAIEIGAAENILVAECVIRGVQRSVLMTGVENGVIVRSSLISAEVKNGTHMYICDNALGGKLYASNNNYILADGNAFPGLTLNEGYKNAESIGNTNTNGNTLMDVTKRLAAGADENLLPHVDRDQFIGKDRKKTVRLPDGDVELSDYVLDSAKNGETVIVAPGAYVMYKNFHFKKEHNNTTLYAYGMFAERPAGDYLPGEHEKAKDYGGDPLAGLIRVGDYNAGVGAENITIKGGTYGYEYQGHAQAQVIKKLPNNQLQLKASAGYIEHFGLSDTTRFISTTYGYRNDRPYNYADTHQIAATLQSDGTVIMTVSADNWEQARIGDIFTARPSHGASAVNTDYSKNITYQDMTIFAAMSSVCFHEYYNASSINYFRVADTYRSGMVISEETYNEYKELEKQIRRNGQTDFTAEVWYDEEHDCYRGPAGRNASLDGVHVVSSAGGAQIIMSLFERLGDDGTNELSSFARLSSIHRIDDETLEVVYKGNLSIYWNQQNVNGTAYWGHGFCQPFKVGQQMIIYTANGGLVLDATAIEEPRTGYKVTNDFWDDPSNKWNTGASSQYELISTYRVKVKINSFDEAVLADYLPYLDTYSAQNGTVESKYNGPAEAYKVYVHNNDMATRGVHIDNTKVSCGRSRAALIKCSDVLIENVTYEHIGMAAIGVYYEEQWGESAVSRNVTIRNSVIDHTGYRTNYIDPAPIAVLAPRVAAPGKDNANPDLNKISLYTDVTISGNVFKNRAIKNGSREDCEYAVSCIGIKNLVIEKNDFGTIYDMKPNSSLLEDAGLLIAPTKTIKLDRINGCRISDNIYPESVTSKKDSFTFKNIKGLTGSDVDGGNMFPQFK